MGFNKKLLDHFSETLRCNQYPKRYPEDKAKIYDIFAKSDTFCSLYHLHHSIISQMKFMILNFREHKKGKHFYLSDNTSRMRSMVHL